MIPSHRTCNFYSKLLLANIQNATYECLGRCSVKFKVKIKKQEVYNGIKGLYEYISH